MKEKVFWGKGISRVLGLMFCLAVCLILMPVTASAAEGDAKVITEINVYGPEKLYADEKYFQLDVSETTYAESDLKNALGIKTVYWEDAATGENATEVVAGHKYRLVYQLSTRYECTFKENAANPGKYGGTVKYNGKIIAADTTLDNSTGSLAIYKEIIAEPAVFTKQPVGGTGKLGQPFHITFDSRASIHDDIVLERGSSSGYRRDESVIPAGTTSWDIQPGKPGETERFCLRTFPVGGNIAYSNEFEVTWESDYFTKEPVGGTSKPGEPYTITFAHRSTACLISLEKYDTATGTWGRQRTFEKGQTSYDIPFGTAEQTEQYRLVINEGGGKGNHIYSNEFEVTWESDYFTKEPGGGTAFDGKPIQVSFAHRSTTLPVLLATGEDNDHLIYLSEVDRDATSVSIPYTEGKVGTTQTYVLVVLDGGGPGVNVYSKPFKINWTDYFKIQPVGGVSEADKPFTIHFANCGTDVEIDVFKYFYLEDGKEQVARTTIGRNQTSYDIPYGTPGETERYFLGFSDNTNACYIVSQDFEIFWREKGVLPRFSKENLVSVPETIAAGSRLAVNDDVLATNDDIVMGYLNGYVTWVYTSAEGKVSTVRFDKDPEYFPITKDMYHGSVHCEVYNDNEDIAWVSSEVSFENIHNFAPGTHRCTVCDLKDPAYSGVVIITKQPSDVTAAVGEEVSFTVAAVGDGLRYQWQYRSAGTTGWSSFITATAKTEKMVFTVGSENLNGCQYRCVVTDKNGKSYHSTVATLTVKAAITITSQPSNVAVAAGETAIFKIAATGEGLQYQWKKSTDGGKNWVNSSSDGCKTDTLTMVTKANYNGLMFKCIVTDKNGNTIESNAVTLTVKEGLAITTQPKNVIVAAGETATFKIAATGDGLQYQWKKSTDGGKNWVNSSSDGCKTDTLTMVTKASYNGLMFKCEVTDKNGKVVESNAATLTVSAGGMTPMSLTVQPKNESVASGSSVTFTIKAAGEGLTYQWKKSTDGGKTWVNSSSTGATTNTLTMATKASFNGYLFKCVVTDKNGKTLTSNPVTLTVTAAGTLAISTQPSNTTVASGATATFKIAATGTGLKYQWKKSTDGGKTWVNSSSTGATTNTLSMATKASYNGLKFKCVVTDANGKSVTSNVVTLTIASAGTLAITTQPTNVTVTGGATATFKVAATGTGLKYQWKKSTDGGNTWVNSSSTGATTNTLSMATKASYNGLKFKCVVTDANGKTVTSNVVTLTVK